MNETEDRFLIHRAPWAVVYRSGVTTDAETGQMKITDPTAIASGSVPGQDGKPSRAVILFTDEDLANRFVEANKAPDDLVVIRIGHPGRLLRILEFLQANHGYEYMVMDTSSKGGAGQGNSINELLPILREKVRNLA